MNAMTIDGPTPRGLGRFTKFAIVVAVHAALFYLLKAGMLRDVVHAVLPQAVQVSFVAQPAPAPASAPKFVPIQQQAPAIAPPPLPLLHIAVEHAITPPARSSEATSAAVPAAAGQPQPAAATVASAPAKPASPRLVQGVEYLRQPEPVYPLQSRRLGESGVVILRVLISDKGLPDQVVVQKSSGFDKLDEAGRAAVMRGLFKPYMEDGRPVAVYVLVPINFQRA